MLEPKLPAVLIVRSRVSEASWRARVQQAEAAGVALDRVLAKEGEGASLNEAIKGELPPSRRSWAMRRLPSYRKHGTEGLIDLRLPRMTAASAATFADVEVAYQEHPGVTPDAIIERLRDAGAERLPSRKKIVRELARARARARRKARQGMKEEEIIDLPLAGGEIVLAAELETNCVRALAEEVVEIGGEAREASVGLTPEADRADRDGDGRFTARYNRKRRRGEGEKIAPHFRSAEEKAEGRVPSWPRFVHEGQDSIMSKVMTLVFEPMVSRIQGWDGLRSPDAVGLGPLTGFAYMPSTLSKLVSALAISGAGPRLLEVTGARWHEVAQERWGESGAMAALYIDNHVKPVWSSLFTQAAKVSSLNRVMPAITTTYAHTGAGTPLVLSVQSGSAPLAKRLPKLVEQAERTLGDSIRRAVVIDSEGSTFDLLEAFTKEKRVIVTPLKPSRSGELELRYSRGSYFRSYRENDELRIAEATLEHKTTGRSLEVGALIVRRSHRDADSILLTTGLALGMEGRDLADLYYQRWPLQENSFKEGAAVRLAGHRGSCGRMVANVAIVTEFEALGTKIQAERTKLAKAVEEAASAADTATAARREHGQVARKLAGRRAALDTQVASGKVSGLAFARTAAEHHTAMGVEESAKLRLDRAEKAQAKTQKRRETLDASVTKKEARAAHIEPQREIRQLDVAQDMILTATKLTGLQLIHFANREYMPGHAMTPTTFTARLLPTRGRLIRRSDEEIIVFYENPRDPEMAAALRTAAERLNERKLVREGRRLSYAVEAPPTVGEDSSDDP